MRFPQCWIVQKVFRPACVVHLIAFTLRVCDVLAVNSVRFLLFKRLLLEQTKSECAKRSMSDALFVRELCPFSPTSIVERGYQYSSVLE